MMTDDELIIAMFDQDQAIARKAKELYDKRHAPDEAPPRPFTADLLIEKFGDQAYDKACRMATEALRAGDRETCRQLCGVGVELLRRGYNKNEASE